MKGCHWKLLILLIVGSVSAYNGGDKIDDSNCTAVYQNRCTCGYGHYPYWKPTESLYIVNCTNSGFTSTEMLEDLDERIQILIFTGNKLPELEWNIFGFFEKTGNLEVVDMSHNQIEEIPGKTYHRVGFVRKLILSHNNLRISGANSHPRLFSNFYELEELDLRNTFSETVDAGYYLKDLKDVFISSNMTKLRKLNLEQNEIWEIQDKNMFCILPSLRELYIGDNQLQSIDIALNCLKKLTLLDVRYNKIKRLDKETIDRLEQAFGNGSGRLIMNENPFHCDCHLRPFYDWVFNTKANINKEDLRCYDGWPKGNAGRRLSSITKLECPPDPLTEESKMAVSTSITQALLLILLLLVATLLSVFIWVNRAQFKGQLAPVVKSVQKSMQYKTINRDDEIIAPEVNV
ncbi:trophoblast glycoprotein [Lepeophtheirus salmonis]|uniref:LRRCT domain-containing protein n=1 Tax=Lepeophtheirus salmonis TaxID=72036 RepID=A0A0K2URF6_LEPSM|nr:leucine-rich repeat-containing protein 15-like [Lepeophtheirus salmonis]